MKYGQPLISTELSGKLGGVVGSTARGGIGYFRRHVIGSNPQSPAQALVRSILASLAAAWQSTLTNAQRTAWGTKAGATESGIDVYTRSNFQQLLSGVAASVATPPTSVALDDSPITSAGPYDVSDGTLAFSELVGTNTSWNVYVSRPQSASREARQYPFVYNQYAGAADTSVNISASTGTLAGIAAGQVFYVRFVAFGSASPKLGRVGQQQIFRVTAQA